MAKFSSEQAVGYVAIQELIHEWARDLDIHNGLHIPELVTEDCSYLVNGAQISGRAAIAKSYQDRITRLAATPAGVPLHRHLLSNLCADFKNNSEASITFTLLYFSSILGHTDPDALAVADVRMNCRRDVDEHWRISLFESNQPFKRSPP